MNRLLTKLLGGPVARRSTKPAARLRIDSLEDRSVPAVFTVTTLTDNAGGVDPAAGDGTGTLRQAIVDANATTEDDEIVFDSSLFTGVPASIDLGSTLTISDTGGALAITGPTTEQLTVQRAPAAATAFRVISSKSPDLSLSDFTISGGTVTAAGVLSAGTTNLDHMTLTGNNAGDLTGGMYVYGGQTVTITSSVISGNTSTQSGGIEVGSGATLNLIGSTVSDNHVTGGPGGGILAHSGSTVHIIDSTITGNSADVVAGGVYIAAGTTLTIQNSVISGNSTTGTGGGLFAGGYASTPTYFSTITVTDSTISGNTADGGGGGIYAGGYTAVSLVNSTVSGNTTTGSGGGVNVRAYNALTVQDSTISGNTAGVGAGIYFGFNGSLAMYGSTISDNHATTTANNLGGGAMYFYGAASTVNAAFPNSLIIVNSTIANNTSASSGGGILLNSFTGGLVLGNTTVVGNTAANTTAGQGGGGIAVIGGTAQIQMANSIVSGNTNVNGPDILSGQYVYSTHSAIGNTSTFTNTGGTGNLPAGANLKLGPLADNGGPTQTLVPQPGSPLIDAGDNTFGSQVGPTDQIGNGHVRISGGTVDIGSYEVQPAAVTVEQAVGQADRTNGSIAFDVNFNVRVTGLNANQFAVTFGGSINPAGATRNLAQDPLDPTHYVLTIGGLTGEGDVTASLPANVVLDNSQTGNAASTSTDNSVHFDAVAPTVTIDQGAGQADRTNGFPIVFDVQFNEDVTGLDFSDVAFTLGGGLTGTPTGTVTMIDAQTYTVEVTGGLTGDGTLTASIPAGKTTDVAGNGNAASTSTDSTVEFDDVAPTVTINPTSAAPTVGGNSVSFNVVFDEAVTGLTGASFNTTGSTAGGTLAVTVEPGPGPAYVVTVTGMSSGGTVVLNLPPGAVTDVAGNEVLASTGDNDVVFVNSGTLQFSAPTYSVSEQGNPQATITVTRVVGAGTAEGSLSVDYATVAGGTATVGTDYTTATGTLTFGPADTTKTFTVPVLEDALVEGDETVDLQLSNPSVVGGLGTPANAVLTITDFAGAFTFSNAKFTAAEGGSASIVVNRVGGNGGAATVDYGFTLGTAEAGDIGTPSIATGTLTFAAGENTKTITLPIVDDTVSEGDETVNFTLSNPAGGAGLGDTPAATLVIAKSDPIIVNATQKFTFKTTDPAPDKDAVTVKLTGSKTGEMDVYLTDDAGPIAAVALVGTDAAKSTLSFVVTKAKPAVGPTANGKSTIDEITGPGALAINAAKMDLVGNGINMTGFVGKVVVGDVSNQADIITGTSATNPKAKTNITAGKIGAGTAITVGGAGGTTGTGIGTLTAIAIGDGTITAPVIGAITVKGATSPAFVAGDLASDVTVSGAGVVTGKPALGKVTVKGTISGDIAVTGVVTGLKAGAIAGSTITADSLGTLQVIGDKHSGLAANVTGVEMTLSGANLDPLKKAALGAFTVSGAVLDSEFKVNGTVTSVAALSFQGSNFYAGFNGTEAGVGTFTAGASLKKFTVSGLANAFQDSNVIATALGPVTLKSVNTDNGGTKFGLITHTTIKSVKISSPGGFVFNPAGQTFGPDFEIRIVA